MITKCANPACSTPLHYLREGRLFQFEVRERNFDPLEKKQAKKHSRGLSHFWLCGPCSAMFTLHFDPIRGVELSPALRFPLPNTSSVSIGIQAS